MSVFLGLFLMSSSRMGRQRMAQDIFLISLELSFIFCSWGLAFHQNLGENISKCREYMSNVVLTKTNILGQHHLNVTHMCIYMYEHLYMINISVLPSRSLLNSLILKIQPEILGAYIPSPTILWCL